MRSFLRHLRGLAGIPDVLSPPAEIYLPALEERWEVVYQKTSSPFVQARCSGNGVLAVTGSVHHREKVLQGLRRWLKRQTRVSLVPWLDELSAQSGLPYGAVSIRGQRTRWASCSARGNINLNYRLLFLPPETVRYILNHELCHTVHLDHSRRFWSCLAELEPDYKIHNKMAKKGMEQVPTWAKG